MAAKVIIRWCPVRTAGWGPVLHLVGLMGRLLGAEVQEVGASRLGRVRRVRRTLFRPETSGQDVVIHIVHNPAEILSAVADPLFDRPAACRVLWIVDSFWSERTPEGLVGNFDLVVHMQKAEADYYDRVSKGRALFVGWGADALDLGSDRAERGVDILRIGRQPADWDDDARTAALARGLGLTFQGRPPEDISYRGLMECYANARFTVSFSNLAAPAPYTHPSKAYFTGRWTDAIASGAVVAGIPPLEDAGVAGLLWEGALLEFDRIDLEENLARLAEAVARWTPDVARRNRRNALARLDWRWGLKRLADRLEMRFPALESDLERLRRGAGADG